MTTPPTTPGLYPMRWSHGTPAMREWRTVPVLASAQGPVVITERGPRPVHLFHGAEWGAATGDDPRKAPPMEDMMNNEKIEKATERTDWKGQAEELAGRVEMIRDYLARADNAFDDTTDHPAAITVHIALQIAKGEAEIDVLRRIALDPRHWANQ